MTTVETYNAIADKLDNIITDIKGMDLTKPYEEVLVEFKTKMPKMQQELENISGELKELIEAEAQEIVLGKRPFEVQLPPAPVIEDANYRNLEFYVAFSINKSVCFITANKTIPVMNNVPLGLGQEIIIDHLQFTISKPRMGNSLRNATKLLWWELNDPDGKPSSNPQYIDTKFEELRALGWQIDNKQFRAKFFPPEPSPVIKSPATKKTLTRKAAAPRRSAR